MVRSQGIPRWLIGIGLFLLSCLLLGCEAEVDDECGGVDNVVSCLSIDRIDPTNIEDTSTSNVDATGSLCPDGSGEPFGDHNAVVSFSNTPFPGVEGDSEIAEAGSQRIIITGYSVTYALNHCPAAATGCPALTGFSSAGPTLTIPPNSSGVTGTFKLVPLAVKEEYVAEGGEVGTGSTVGAPYPSYSANYVFSAKTEFFEDDITIRASVEFTIGGFNLCGG
jgi:hypothetical protein